MNKFENALTQGFTCGLIQGPGTKHVPHNLQIQGATFSAGDKFIQVVATLVLFLAAELHIRTGCVVEGLTF